MIFARLEDEGKDRISAFLMETDREGFNLDKVEHKMGLRGSPTCAFAGVERRMRDAKVFQIFEGTNQIQRLLIARDFFQRPRLTAG